MQTYRQRQLSHLLATSFHPSERPLAQKDRQTDMAIDLDDYTQFNCPPVEDCVEVSSVDEPIWMAVNVLYCWTKRCRANHISILTCTLDQHVGNRVNSLLPETHLPAFDCN